MIPANEKTLRRVQCLEMAVAVAKNTGNPDAIVPTAEKLWQWLSSDADFMVTPTPDEDNDDIPF